MTNLEIVIAELEKRQSEMLKVHSQRLVRLEAESAEYRRRTDQNLAEITNKLNGFSGYVSGQQPPSAPKSN
jgi:hypothetical protein